MKGAVVSLGSTSSEMVVESMKKYFDEVDMIQLRNIEVRLGKESGIFYEGKLLEHYDCVYVKGSFRFANLLRSISALLEGKVPYMPLPASSFTTVHNKLLTHLALEQQNIPMPRTYISSTIEEAKILLKRVHYPIVMKFPEGTQGKGVMFADSQSSAASLLDALGALNQPFIIQEYVETNGEDIRAIVVGDKVVASMKRVAQKGEKRANTHSGGEPKAILLSHESSKIAVKTAKALGADVCGVDILESPRGPLVIEANISPGLQGIQSVSTINIADEIAKFFARKTEEMVHGKKKEKAKEVMSEISLDGNESQKIISSLTFRGDRIILPVIANKIAKFHDDKEFALTLRKGKIEIEEAN
jgi:ribosomal protein S6--L-glutamate ligase